MRAWTVDADDIRVAEDFDQSLLHRTPDIDAFLSPERDDRFIVIGTKGLGKTLLLKAKRVLCQSSGQTLCLPNGSLLDKPIGDKIFSRESIAFFAVSPLPWARLWLAAISLTTLKQAGAVQGLKVNPALAALVADEGLHSVIDHFVRLLDFSPKELQRSASDIDGHLVPRLRMVKMSMTFFVDGIDEYFNKHLEERSTHPSVTGELSPEVWHFAQLGLVEVAYQLRRINHHLRIFAAIRKEAYSRLPGRTAMAQQYRGSAVDIAYSADGLREIFINNIRLQKAERLVLPGKVRSQPMLAFLGRSQVTDSLTREDEDAFDYLCRHSLLRPRDLMTIGDRLATLRPEERCHEHQLKAAVQQAASEIAQEYLAEIAPYVAHLTLEQLFQQLPGRSFSALELDALVAACAEQGHDGASALAAMYRVGLLGLVKPDLVRGGWRQRFLRPGEAAIDSQAALPRAAYYLLHPVLCDLVAHLNPGFLQRHDGRNILGHDRPWLDPGREQRPAKARQCCVLKADVHGFGRLMRAGKDGPVRKALEDAVTRWAPAAAIAETGSGDAALIADDDPEALARTARHLMDEVYRVPGQPRLRIALHHGEVLTRAREVDQREVIAGGQAILHASRVEPVVAPGQIWATDEFRQQFVLRPSLWRLVPLASANGEPLFNLRKNGSAEPDLWVPLHRLES